MFGKLTPPLLFAISFPQTDRPKDKERRTRTSGPCSPKLLSFLCSRKQEIEMTMTPVLKERKLQSLSHNPVQVIQYLAKCKPLKSIILRIYRFFFRLSHPPIRQITCNGAFNVATRQE